MKNINAPGGYPIGIGLPITREPSHTTGHTDHGGSADQAGQFPGRNKPRSRKYLFGKAMITHFILLMCHIFLRALPHKKASLRDIPSLSRLRTRVLGFFHCVQRRHLNRLSIHPFKDLNLARP
jgi:hypothetical protein